jgi:hypothetical protein
MKPSDRAELLRIVVVGIIALCGCVCMILKVEGGQAIVTTTLGVLAGWSARHSHSK